MPMFSVISSRERILGSGVLRSPGINTPESAAARGITSRKTIMPFNMLAFLAARRLKQYEPGSLRKPFDGHAYDAVVCSDEKIAGRGRQGGHVQRRKSVGERTPTVFCRVIDKQSTIKGSCQDAVRNGEHCIRIDDGGAREIRKFAPLSIGVQLNHSGAVRTHEPGVLETNDGGNPVLLK